MNRHFLDRSNKKSPAGFTIIEVMIVLVIAVIILLVVFLAVPALQRSARNKQRERDAFAVLNAINECLLRNYRVMTACDTPEEILIQDVKLAIYTGAHYGNDVGAGAVGNPMPPTIDEPNWAFGLRCTADGTWFSNPLGGPTFVVTFFREQANGTPFSRCIDGQV